MTQLEKAMKTYEEAMNPNSRFILNVIDFEKDNAIAFENITIHQDNN